MSAEVTSPFTVFFDRSGQPLDNGYVYIGTAGINPEVSPITVYWDTSLTTTAAQPIRTLAGYPSRDGSPSSIIASRSPYSILVKDRTGTLVYSDLNASSDAPVVLYVQNYAELTALSPADGLTDGAIYSVAGYSIAGDGGAGEWRYSASSTTAADGATILAVDGGGAGRFFRLYDGSQVQIEWFGAVGNGTTSDTAAFNAFNAWAVALPAGSAATLNLTRGKTYMVGNPWWPINIRKLTVNGNGCKLKNNATDNKDKMLLVPASGTNATKAGSFYTPVSRYLISTTTVGATSITCTTAAEAGNLAAGDMIMVASFDLQFEGAPCNYMYFEYHEVTGVNAGTGVVTLKGALAYVHKANFPYLSTYPEGDGRAHIEKIEQACLFNISHTYNDIEFVRNNVSSSGAVTEAPYTTGRFITFNRCKSETWNPTINETLIMNECVQNSTGAGEIDKLITSMEATDCTWHGRLDSATSCNTLTFKRSNLFGGVRMCPTNLIVEDSVILGEALIFTAYGSLQTLKCKNSIVDPWWEFTTNETQTQQVTINGTTVVWNGATNTLTLALTSSDRRFFLSKMFPGRIISVVTPTSGKDLATGVFGVVQSITGGDATASIVVSFNAALAGTEKLVVYEEPRLTELEYTDARGRLTKRDYVKLAHSKYELLELTVTSSYALEPVEVNGRVTRIVIDVLRAYSGATGGNITLNLLNFFPAYGARVNRFVDLKTTGRREMTMLGNAGWTGAGGESAGASLTSAAYASDFVSALGFYAVPMASTSDAQLPVVSVTIEFESPYSAD